MGDLSKEDIKWSDLSGKQKSYIKRKLRFVAIPGIIFPHIGMLWTRSYRRFLGFFILNFGLGFLNEASWLRVLLFIIGMIIVGFNFFKRAFNNSKGYTKNLAFKENDKSPPFIFLVWLPMVLILFIFIAVIIPHLLMFFE